MFRRARQRAFIGEPLGADGSARPTEREREDAKRLKPREWDALGVGGGSCFPSREALDKNGDSHLPRDGCQGTTGSMPAGPCLTHLANATPAAKEQSSLARRLPSGHLPINRKRRDRRGN